MKKGRPLSGDTAKQMIAFRLSPCVIKVIKEQPNQVKFIEDAIKEKLERDNQ